MDYVVSTMHMQGFSRMFRPAAYAPSEADHDAVKARGKEIMEKGLAIMDKALEGKEYVAGKFSVADRSAREGVNPQTGEKIQIAASKVPRFSAGSGLKKSVKTG